MTSLLESEDAQRGAQALVGTCAALANGERALIIDNPETAGVADLVEQYARAITPHVRRVSEPTARMHGGEPSENTARHMLESDVIFCLTTKSLAHSRARFDASAAGARYLSLPDYSPEQLVSPALQFDFTSLAQEADRLASLLDVGRQVHVTSEAGTDVRFTIEGRSANRAPGIVRAGGDLGSPPDAEVNVAPIESLSRGRIVIDGSIPCNEIGLLPSPVILTLEEGSIVGISGYQPAVAALEQLFAGAGPKSRVLAEFGIGLNPLAQLCGRMLEDEGCGGTIHFGFGSNATIGGLNKVGFHLDFIMKHPHVLIDGVAVQLVS